MRAQEIGGVQAEAERIMPVEALDPPSPDGPMPGSSRAGTSRAAAGDELDFGAGSRRTEADDGRAGGGRCP